MEHLKLDLMQLDGGMVYDRRAIVALSAVPFMLSDGATWLLKTIALTTVPRAWPVRAQRERLQWEYIPDGPLCDIPDRRTQSCRLFQIFNGYHLSQCLDIGCTSQQACTRASSAGNQKFVYTSGCYDTQGVYAPCRRGRRTRAHQHPRS
jgi:hypothetical protein